MSMSQTDQHKGSTLIKYAFFHSITKLNDWSERTADVSYLLQTWGETCCGWTCWQVGAVVSVWPWAPSISSPRTSRAVSGKHGEDQPQGSRSKVLLDIEWQLDDVWGRWEDMKVHPAEELTINVSKIVTGDYLPQANSEKTEHKQKSNSKYTPNIVSTFIL